MAETQLHLVFRDKLRRAVLDSLMLDASISEVHSGKVEVTEHPVEKGGNIADHARAKAETVTIEGVVSNTPIPVGGDARFQRAEGQEFPVGVAGRAQEAWKTLRELKDSGRPVTIITALVQYENMVMEDLQVPRNAQNADVLHFTATFKAVRLVSSQTIAAPTSVTSAKSKIKGGKKDAAGASPKVKKSVLADMEDSWKSGAPKKWLGDHLPGIGP